MMTDSETILLAVRRLLTRPERIQIGASPSVITYRRIKPR